MAAGVETATGRIVRKSLQITPRFSHFFIDASTGRSGVYQGSPDDKRVGVSEFRRDLREPNANR
jgi:hypothetical protein